MADKEAVFKFTAALHPSIHSVTHYSDSGNGIAVTNSGYLNES
jgi:hypothetical protein